MVTRDDWAALVTSAATYAQATRYPCSQCGNEYTPAIIDVIDETAWGVCTNCDNQGSLAGSPEFNPAKYPRWNALRFRGRTIAEPATVAAVAGS